MGTCSMCDKEALTVGLCRQHYDRERARVILESKGLEQKPMKIVVHKQCLPGCNSGSDHQCKKCRQHVLYEGRRALGLCYSCGGVRESEFKQCETCRKKYNVGRYAKIKLAEYKKHKRQREGVHG